MSVARRARATKLEARAARLKLPVAKKPVFAKIGPGLGLGYRRNATAGTWAVRAANGQGGNWTNAIGTADDFDEADDKTVLDFWQAKDRARVISRVGRAPTRPSAPNWCSRRSRSPSSYLLLVVGPDPAEPYPEPDQIGAQLSRRYAGKIVLETTSPELFAPRSPGDPAKNSSSHWTLRWREMDSNFRFRAR